MIALRRDRNPAISTEEAPQLDTLTSAILLHDCGLQEKAVVVPSQFVISPGFCNRRNDNFLFILLFFSEGPLGPRHCGPLAGSVGTSLVQLELLH
jgi:hypothetical protein